MYWFNQTADKTQLVSASIPTEDWIQIQSSGTTEEICRRASTCGFAKNPQFYQLQFVFSSLDLILGPWLAPFLFFFSFFWRHLDEPDWWIPPLDTSKYLEISGESHRGVDYLYKQHHNKRMQENVANILAHVHIHQTLPEHEKRSGSLCKN